MQYLDYQSRQPEIIDGLSSQFGIGFFRKPDPTPEEIQAYCLELQKTWGEVEKARRMSIIPYSKIRIRQRRQVNGTTEFE